MIHPVFRDVIGHDAILRILSDAVRKPAPAYVFFGPDGSGKRMIAERFASLLLFPDASCATHRVSRMLDAHPDFVRAVREEGAREFTVKQARALVTRMRLTSACGGRTVAFFDEAERVNAEAANALLKAVEEPSAQSVYVFVTSQPDRLPATLRSRLAPLRFDRVPFGCLRDALRAHGADAESAEEAARLSRGIPADAKRFLEDPAAWHAREHEAADACETWISRPLGRTLAALEALAKSAESAEDSEAAWRVSLLFMMKACADRFAADPVVAARLGEGLMHAWRFTGSALSPRLALEWAALSPYLTEEDQTLEAFFRPRYL